MPYNDQGIGYQKTDTSEAATKIAPLSLRDRALVHFWRCKPGDGFTVEELADKMGLPHKYGLAPRITELKNEGKIGDTGQRRKLESGTGGIVWGQRHEGLANAAD